METQASLQNQALDIRASLHKNSKSLPRDLQRKISIAILIAVDASMLALSLICAYQFRFRTTLPIFYYGETKETFLLFYVAVSVACLLIWLVLFWMHRLYDWSILLGGLTEYAEIFRACLLGAVLLAFSEFVFNTLPIARGWVGLFGFTSFLFVALGRFGLRRLAYAARRHGYLVSPAVIIGANEEGRAVGEQIMAWPTSGLHVIGYLDDEVEPGSVIHHGLQVIGTLAQLDDIVNKHHIEEFVIAASAIPRETLLNIFTRYGVNSDVNLRLSSGLFEILTTGLEIKEIAYVPLIAINRVRLTGADFIIKTIMEYTLATAALVVLSPLLMLIAILVKLDSPGPALYRRQVMGLNGKQFNAFKFRTMHVNGDAILNASPELMDELVTKHKIKGDPRITRLGQLLRKYSLDELPQFINVLRGEMSIVGPRMISPPELKRYGSLAVNLLTIRPGITGLWQVSGRSNISYEDRVRMDMFYIRNYSIWLDLHLIMRTIPVIFSGKGAY